VVRVAVQDFILYVTSRLVLVVILLLLWRRGFGRRVEHQRRRWIDFDNPWCKTSVQNHVRRQQLKTLHRLALLSGLASLASFWRGCRWEIGGSRENCDAHRVLNGGPDVVNGYFRGCQVVEQATFASDVLHLFWVCIQMCNMSLLPNFVRHSFRIRMGGNEHMTIMIEP